MPILEASHKIYHTCMGTEKHIIKTSSLRSNKFKYSSHLIQRQDAYRCSKPHCCIWARMSCKARFRRSGESVTRSSISCLIVNISLSRSTLSIKLSNSTGCKLRSKSILQTPSSVRFSKSCTLFGRRDTLMHLSHVPTYLQTRCAELVSHSKNEKFRRSEVSGSSRHHVAHL